jgi:hypothetical protein
MPKADSISQGIHKALLLLQRATTTSGILASTEETANYRRIWARDGIVCGLAGLLANDEILINGLKATLITLVKHQGPEGQIPSNVQVEEKTQTSIVSYGGLVGRVDPNLWFIIGVCNYLHQIPNNAFKKRMEIPLERCLRLLTAWEFNSRGLLYVPQGGDWADEFILSGYVLYDQLLRLWALRSYAEIYQDNEARKKSDDLLFKIQVNYWPRPDFQDWHLLSHPSAYKRILKTPPKSKYWLSAFMPAGYFRLFDTISNSLAVILDIGEKKQVDQVIKFGQSLTKQIVYQLLPSFWPPIDETHHQWKQLRNNYSHKFRNYPYQYQNGGVWAIINAWWGVALVRAGKIDQAQQILEGILQLNKLDMNGDDGWGFYEYVHAQTGHPGGTRHFSWSAAAVLLLNAALGKKVLLYG